MTREKYTSKATFCIKNYPNLMMELGERSIWNFQSCILHVDGDVLSIVTINQNWGKWENINVNMQNATFKNSNRPFSELRHQILIIFGAKCSFTPVLSTYQLLSKFYDKQKRYFERNWFLLNRFGQICGFWKADFDPKPRFRP